MSQILDVIASLKNKLWTGPLNDILTTSMEVIFKVKVTTENDIQWKFTH